MIDFFPHPGCQVVRGWIILQIKLRPHNQMHDFLVNTVWPVIINNFQVALQKIVSKRELFNGLRIQLGSLNGFAFLGVRSLHCNRFSTTKFITDPYSFLSLKA